MDLISLMEPLMSDADRLKDLSSQLQSVSQRG